MSDGKDAYSPNEFCKAYSISRAQFYKEVKARLLPIRKLGRKTLVLAVDAEEWARNLPRG